MYHLEGWCERFYFARVVVFVEGQELATRMKTNCASHALGGRISGEIRMAIMLRIMAGASYLDLLLIYGVSTASVYSVFHKANDWILASTFQFPLVKWIVSDDSTEALNRVAEGFSSASGGTFRKMYWSISWRCNQNQVSVSQRLDPRATLETTFAERVFML